MRIHTIDWIVILVYLIGMIALSIFLARGQKSKSDYYLGGNNTGPWPIAISTLATQCSTNSILGAPAFVAFTAGGGLVWLQYELALPFAMIFLMIFLLPLYRRLGIISVYAYLEKRFDRPTRLILSVFFQLYRSFVTGVTVYGISLVISYCMGISFATSVFLLGVVTVIYDSIGGMKAVIISDVIQMAILFGAIILTIYEALNLNNGLSATLNSFSPERMKAIDFSSFGFDGSSYTFWPMVIGGFFLYVSYYGCDQTQVQRELATKNVDDTNMSLFINGLLRFPLVLSYCFLGVCLGAYVSQHPEFVDALPLKNGDPEYNLAVPIFVIKNFPVGLVGIVMVGLFSAAMSSLDSTINSLSATTMQDIFRCGFKAEFSERQELWISKGLTIFWGTICTLFAFYVGDISQSIIESINKIGSVASGPILGVFLLGIFTTRACGLGAIVGLLAGVFTNLILWFKFVSVSWLWWNAIGCLACVATGYIFSLLIKVPPKQKIDHLTYKSMHEHQKEYFKKEWSRYYKILAFYGTAITIFCSSI